MFRSSTIIRELALNLAKVIFMLKHSVKLCHYVAVWQHAATQHKYNFSQVQCRLPDDGRRPKHVGAIIMCILMCFFKIKMCICW